MKFTPRFPLVFFLHIPKAAGSTVGLILKRHYGRRLLRLGHLPDRHEEEVRSAFTGQHNVQLVSGHYRYGLHRAIPDGPQHVPHITFLRHPLERMPSFYHYIHTRPHHYYYDVLKSSQETFEQFLSNPKSPEIHSQQTRLIAGCNTLPRDIDESEFERALDNMRRHFVFVGLQERFDESLVALKLILGLNDVTYIVANRNAHRPRLNLSDNVIELIKETNRFDIRLHELAAQRLDETIAEFGQRFTDEFERFTEMQNGWRLSRLVEQSVYQVRSRAYKLKNQVRKVIVA